MAEISEPHPQTNESSGEPMMVDEEDKMISNYVKRVKTAVAVSIIKSTPQGMSAREYAEALIQEFKLKHECSNLEEDAFHQQQKLELTKMNEIIKNAGSIIERRLEHIPQPQINPETTNKQREYIEANISDTAEFVKSFILLESVTHVGYPAANQSDALRENRKEMVSKSVSRLFRYLRCDIGLQTELDLVKKAIYEVMKLFGVPFANSNGALVQMCLAFVDDILKDIHKTLDINKVDAQHRRSALIELLAEHRSLTILILCRLLREITVTADFFEGLFHPDNENFLPLLHSENTYYVLQAMEGVLRIMEHQKSPLDALKIPQNLLAEWELTTSKSLTVLGTHFPLYSLYVWNLKYRMKSVIDDCCEGLL